MLPEAYRVMACGSGSAFGFVAEPRLMLIWAVEVFRSLGFKSIVVNPPHGLGFRV